MAASCPECGAALPEGGACIDHFHALLLLEYEVLADPSVASGGRGEVAHFHAVSSYVLQHPEGMNYTAEAVVGLRRSLADHLAGRITLAEQRSRVRRAADGATRVTRRAGDEVTRWHVASWPMTVTDVLSGGVEGYCARVARWAESILRTLDEAGA
ncbi:DUF5946 family protein [Aquisphaera insulae]|uniref:DUF5946 family protein n=1 Tax=Aquisphaera insulae TaxID=2712864 RepID=UPI0013ED9CDD|nr:DUF5946 family protein [Aquisphaera insulae]